MLYYKALFLGFIVAIPIGPVALLIIQRTIRAGVASGFFSGIGAALADSLFAFLATIGLVTLLEEIQISRIMIRPVGGVILLLVGSYYLYQDPASGRESRFSDIQSWKNRLWDLGSTFFLTLTNPATIFAFTAIFAGTEIIPIDPAKLDYVAISLGVFTGSTVWWSFIISMASPLKARMSPQIEHRISQIIGLLLIGLGIFSISPLFIKYLGKGPLL